MRFRNSTASWVDLKTLGQVNRKKSTEGKELLLTLNIQKRGKTQQLLHHVTTGKGG